MNKCLYAKINISIIETKQFYLTEQCVQTYFSTNVTSCYKMIGFEQIYLDNNSLIMSSIGAYIFSFISFAIVIFLSCYLVHYFVKKLNQL